MLLLYFSLLSTLLWFNIYHYANLIRYMQKIFGIGQINDGVFSFLFPPSTLAQAQIYIPPLSPPFFRLLSLFLTNVFSSIIIQSSNWPITENMHRVLHQDMNLINCIVLLTLNRIHFSVKKWRNNSLSLFFF